MRKKLTGENFKRERERERSVTFPMILHHNHSALPHSQGNKGATGIRFSLYGCSVCVVNCHLAPHDAGYKERVDHFNAIVDGTQFPVQETSNILYHE